MEFIIPFSLTVEVEMVDEAQLRLKQGDTIDTGLGGSRGNGG